MFTEKMNFVDFTIVLGLTIIWGMGIISIIDGSINIGLIIWIGFLSSVILSCGWLTKTSIKIIEGKAI